MTKKSKSPGSYSGVDGSIKMIADIIKQAELVRGVVDKGRCAELNAAYSMLADYFDGVEDIDVTCCYSKTLKNMAVISIEGPVLAFNDPSVLFDAAKLANNLDVCGKTNGCVSFELTFYGLARAVRR